MCVAAPGKIISINENEAVVDYNGNKNKAQIGLVNAKIGDWVLVHAGLVIQVLPQDEADSMLELYKELEEL